MLFRANFEHELAFVIPGVGMEPRAGVEVSVVGPCFFNVSLPNAHWFAGRVNRAASSRV